MVAREAVGRVEYKVLEQMTALRKDATVGLLVGIRRELDVAVTETAGHTARWGMIIG